jgi:hypothetical protein
MVGPLLTARMKQKGWVAGFRIGSSDIASLKAIALRATESKVIDCRFAPMRDGNNVFDMKSDVTVLLADMAVFAATISPFKYNVP